MKLNRVILITMMVMLMASLAMAEDVQTIVRKLPPISIGTDIDVVIDRDVNLENTDTKGEMDLEWYLATIDVDMVDWLRITPKIGVVHQVFSTDQYEGIANPFTGGLLGEIEAESEPGFAIGIAGEADLYTTKELANINSNLALADGITVTAFGEYLYGRTEVSNIDFGGIEIDNPIRNDLTIHQWEAGLKASKTIGVITPYIGVAYSDLVGEYDFEGLVANLNEDIEADDNWGLRLGATAKPLENIALSIDAKLGDQLAIGGSAKVKF